MHKRVTRTPVRLGVEPGKMADNMRTIGRMLPDDMKRQVDATRLRNGMLPLFGIAVDDRRAERVAAG